MSRVEIDETILASQGGHLRPAAGASVLVAERGTSTAATVYQAATGGTTLSNPLTADDAGRVDGYLPVGSYDLVVTYAGVTYRQPWNATGPVDVATTEAGNLGATYTFELNDAAEAMLEGTLNANCVLTVDGLTPGCKFHLFVAQDATGGRTLTLSNGSASTAAAISSTASALSAIHGYSIDGDDFVFEVG